MIKKLIEFLNSYEELVDRVKENEEAIVDINNRLARAREVIDKVKPAPQWEAIDKGITLPKASHEPIVVTIDNYRDFEYKIIRNSGRFLIKDLSDIILKHIRFENVYCVEINNSSRIQMMDVGIDGSSKGFHIRNKSHDILLEDWFSNHADDVKTGATNHDGDGLIIQNDCHHIVCKYGETYYNLDCGLDIKGDAVTIEDHISNNNSKGLKWWWGTGNMNNATFQDNSDNGILQIGGVLTCDEECVIEGSKTSIQMGLSQWADKPKKLIYQGTYDGDIKKDGQSEFIK